MLVAGQRGRLSLVLPGCPGFLSPTSPAFNGPVRLQRMNSTYPACLYPSGLYWVGYRRLWLARVRICFGQLARYHLCISRLCKSAGLIDWSLRRVHVTVCSLCDVPEWG